ncbi:ester cyclase [Oerskovia sp. M15]
MPHGYFRGLAPTGRRFTVREMHMLRFAEGREAEHWAVRDDAWLVRELSEHTVVPTSAVLAATHPAPRGQQRAGRGLSRGQHAASGPGTASAWRSPRAAPGGPAARSTDRPPACPGRRRATGPRPRAQRLARELDLHARALHVPVASADAPSVGPTTARTRAATGTPCARTWTDAANHPDVAPSPEPSGAGSQPASARTSSASHTDRSPRSGRP